MLERKEQTCAARRAFRKRKEKHVRDASPACMTSLDRAYPIVVRSQREDQAVALEAKKRSTVQEDENVGDVLERVQNGNTMLVAMREQRLER